MDIAQLSMDMAQSRVMNDVSIALMSKAMDTFEESGAALTDMMSSAYTPTINDVNPAIGGHIDLAI